MSNSNICPMCGSLAHPSAKFCYRCGCALKNGNSKSLSQNSINISSDVNPILENSVKAAGMAEGVSFFERNSQHDKYHSLRGYGFAAEDANALNDVLHGHSVVKTGLDNLKNGSDRTVDNVAIQVKYCKTPRDTVRSLFDNQGEYRYANMKIEVPKGQGEEVRTLLREKAYHGKIKDKNGNVITDLNKIDNLVQEGSITYQQAQNIAKAGTIDSIWFDVKNSAVSCSCAFGLSFVISLAYAVWSGKNIEKAFNDALKQSLATGIGSLVISVTSQQLMRTSASRIGKVAGHYMIHNLYKTQIGKTLIDRLATYSLGAENVISGFPAINQVSKLLRSNVITGVVTTAVLTAPDFYRTAISGTASWKQLGKNLTINAASVAGGTGGWMLGAAVGSFFGPIGAVIGGALGAVAGGSTAGTVTKAVADAITPDDSEEMLGLCNDAMADLASEYLLTEKEMTVFIGCMQKTINIDFLRSMYASGSCNSERRKYVSDIMCEHIVKKIIEHRQKFTTPSDDLCAVLIYHSLEQLEKEAATA